MAIRQVGYCMPHFFNILMVGILWVAVGVSEKNKSGSSGGNDDYVVKKKGNTTIKYKKKTTYDFEGLNLDGMYNKPSGAYVSNIKDVKAKTIIRMRENFDNEVSDTTRMLK